MPILQRNARRRLAICLIAGALSVSCSGEDRSSEQPPSAGPTTTAGTDSSTTAAPKTTTTVGGAHPSTDPCVIAEPEMVEEAFGGEVLGELKIGVTCRHGLEGGAAEWADVLWIGPAEEWEEIKSTYSETRGGIIEVDVLGRRVSILLTTVSEI